MEKPSQQIQEIAMRDKKIGYNEHDLLQAVITYLDEQYEARIHKEGWCDKCQGFHDKEEIMP